MAPVTRLSLARQAYQDALLMARAQSTARTWARLLRAARNLRDAESKQHPTDASGYRGRE